MRDKRDLYVLATCVFCSIGRFIPIAYHAIYGGGATCVLPPQDMCSVVGSFILLCQITPFQNKSRWPHFKIVQFPNNPIWGHLKWDFSPFVSNIIIWGQGLRHRERLQCGQKSVVTLNAWIVTSWIQQCGHKRISNAPKLGYLAQRAKKLQICPQKPCCRHLLS